MHIARIVSGAQTGADRAALDAALEAGVASGGWVPKGRRAEDGVIPGHYPNLRETPTAEYEVRTRWNVRDSDATLILSHGPLTGGSKFTREVAHSMGKPVLHLDLSAVPFQTALTTIRDWLHGLEGDTLNVAGPRASSDTSIYDDARRIIEAVLAR